MSNITKKEMSQVEKIRSQYLDPQSNNVENIKKLDRKVKMPGTIVAYVLGIVGALVMGSGMSLIMVNGTLQTGLALSIPGLVVALAAYPVYKLITNSRKKKYANEILQLSNNAIG